MYCERCRKEVGNLEYCENCGGSTVGNMTQEQTAATGSVSIPNDELITLDSLKKTLKRISIKKVITFGLIAVVVIGGFISYSKLKDSASPENTAKRYVNELVSGDYDKAFTMVEGSDNIFLTKENYKKYMELLKVKGRKIVDVRQSSADMDRELQSVFGTIKEKEEIKENEQMPFNVQLDSDIYGVILVKRGKVFGIFDGWKVDTSNFVKNWEITAPKGTKLTIEGKLVEKIKDNGISGGALFGTPETETVTFQVEKIFPGNYEISATMEGAKDLKLKASTEQQQTIKFEPNEKLVADLRQVAESSFKIYYSKGDKSSFDGLVYQDSNFIKNLGNGWVDDRSNYKSQTLKSLEVTETKIQDGTHAILNIKNVFSYEKEESDFWGSTDKTIKKGEYEEEFTITYEKKDGKWLAKEIRSKGGF